MNYIIPTKFLLSFALIIISFGSKAQSNFYNIDSIPKIEITFKQSNWDYQMDTAKAGKKGYIIATQCKINGLVYDSVGVKYKGNSSYKASQTKNPLHINLDYIKGNQNYDGYTEIKLSNGRSDPSMVREMLSYEILRNYMDAPLANSAEVYINGTYYGLYTNCQSISKSFLGKQFYSNDNAFFKCNPVSVFGSSNPDLKYLGTSASSYYNCYELHSASTKDWNQLVNLCDTLNNSFSNIESILDIDRAIWMLAFDNVLINLDSYLGSFRQNYYLFRDDNNRFCPIIWDLNMSFGGFTQLAGMTRLDTTGMKNLSPSANSTSANHPLVQKIWGNPTYQRMYIAHMKTITTEMFSSGWYFKRAQQMQSIIDTAVYNDKYKFFTNAQFNSALTSNISSGMPGNYIPGIVNLMKGRVNYLTNTSYFTNTPPTISGISVSKTSPDVFTSVYVTATISSPTYLYVGYRSQRPSKFIKVLMKDDGLNGDGAASDGVYGASIPLNSAITEYYIYAENAKAGLFAPQRAEHEFYTITATTPTQDTGQVVINEILPNNNAATPDHNGQYDDWLELYNNTSNSIALKGLFLSDTSGKLKMFQWHRQVGG
ncbi:MAG: CotH kinase family protein [Bacteroidetes bacterium]|nr:CotH kinase family protein [Bacteroidota bacterium]